MHDRAHGQIESGTLHPVDQNQLRLHFAYLKCPIVGDRVYGRRAPSLLLRRHFLHAHRLGFRLPGGGQPCRFESPLPPELLNVLDLLAR